MDGTNIHRQNTNMIINENDLSIVHEYIIVKLDHLLKNDDSEIREKDIINSTISTSLTKSEKINELKITNISDKIVDGSIFPLDVILCDAKKDGTLEIEKGKYDILRAKYMKIDNISESKTKLNLINNLIGKRIKLINHNKKYNDNSHYLEFEGILKNIRGNMIILKKEDANNTIIVTKLPSSYTIEILDEHKQKNTNDEILFIDPFLRIGLELNKKIPSPLENKYVIIPIIYHTHGLHFKFNYIFIVNDDGDTLEFIIKAIISNDTNADFDPKRIELIEESPPDTYSSKKSYNLKHAIPTSAAVNNYQKRSSRRSIGGYNDNNTLMEMEGEEEDSEKELNTQPRKNFSLESNLIGEIKANQQKDLIYHKTTNNIPCKIYYLFKPQKTGKMVQVFLKWENNTTKDNEKIKLPIGDVKVFQKKKKNNILTSLGETKIAKNNNLDIVRMDLGTATTVSCVMERPNVSINNKNQYKTLSYVLKVKNQQHSPVNIMIKYEFPSPSWKMEQGSDIEFKVYKPDDTNDNYVRKNAFSEFIMDSNTTKLFKFSIGYFSS